MSSKEEEGEKRERRERREERERERRGRAVGDRDGDGKKTLAEKHVVSRFPCFRLHGKRPNSILFAT